MGTSRRQLVLKLRNALSTMGGVVGTAKKSASLTLDWKLWGFFPFSCLVGIAHPLCSHNTIFQGVYMSEKSSSYHFHHGRGQGWLQLLCARGLGDLKQSLHGHCCWVMSPPSLATPRKILTLVFWNTKVIASDFWWLNIFTCGVKAFGI